MSVAKLLLACGLFLGPVHCAMAGPSPINLGDAATFAILAGSAVTNTGASTANGDIGWSSLQIPELPDGLTVNGSVHADDGTALQAEAALTSAYLAASDETGAQSLTGADLGGMTLTPGVYAFASSAQLTGMLTLDAEGATNAAFIFQIGSTLTTATNSLVQLANFGAGDQVIWQIGSSATLGTDTAFAGDILALTSITLNTGASITCGGALALNGAVTLDDSNVSTSGSACAADGAAVPEPASFSVLLAGMIAIAGLKRQQTHRKAVVESSL